MGRILEPSNYGILASIISLIGLVSLIPSSVGLVVTKMVSSGKTNDEISERVHALNKHIWLMGIALFLALLTISPVIAGFLKVDEILLVIGLLVFLLSFPASLTRSILQGLLRFKSMVISQTLENVWRLVTAIALIILGFSVAGGLLGLLLGVCTGWLISWLYIRGVMKKPKSKKLEINFSSTLKSSLPFFILSVSVTSFYSSDLILVKHFFTSFDAGIYSAMSFLGRIIFFGVSPITAVMFPIVARSHSRGENGMDVLKWSLAGGLIIALAVNTIYALFPSFVIKQLYGEKYLAVDNLLLLFGIFVTFVTLSFLLLNYELIMNRVKVVWVSLIAAFIQIVLIWFFHSSLYSVVLVSTFVAMTLLLYLVFDTFYLSSKK